jgi:hypothetical protein
MAYNYQVSYGTTSTGPWTTFNTVSSLTDTISGLNSGTAYFIQVIPIDTTTMIQGAASVIGPISTTINVPTAPTLQPAGGITNTQVVLTWTASVG